MNRRFLACLVAGCAIAVVPVLAHAQTAVTDVNVTNPTEDPVNPYLWNMRVNVIRNQNDGPAYTYVTIQGQLARVPPLNAARGQ